MRVYCDKMVKGSIMRFLIKCSLVPQLFAYQVWWMMMKFEGGPLVPGLGCFLLCDAISCKWCKIELRWHLITNRESYMSFRLQQKSMTSNDLECQFTALSSVLHVLCGIRQLLCTEYCWLCNVWVKYWSVMVTLTVVLHWQLNDQFSHMALLLVFVSADRELCMNYQHIQIPDTRISITLHIVYLQW